MYSSIVHFFETILCIAISSLSLLFIFFSPSAHKLQSRFYNQHNHIYGNVNIFNSHLRLLVYKILKILHTYFHNCNLLKINNYRIFLEDN